MWRAVSQLLSRAVIETPFNLLNLLRRQTRKRAVLGQVLTDQRIGVLDVWLVCRAVGARKKQAPLNCPQCSYCDFYTQTGSRLRRDFIDALIRELHLRRGELPDGAFIEHIYFGGGHLRSSRLTN